jgi:RNA polymerase sigma-70 factor (ECF subfamily)
MPADTALQAAQRGDEAAFGALVEPLRSELHAHCYRMLGSLHDADDALQDTLLKAWRGLARFEGRSKLRSWLYTIATNVCLTMLERRRQRVLPLDHGPAADPVAPFETPVTESIWIEPYPDAALSVEQRESVELAFVAALQHLPATQRAVLIMREVLGFSAREAAEVLGTTVASINSALQRARAAVDERVPEQTQQATLRAVGDRAVRDLVDRYVDAWERCDVDAFVEMLTEDATFSMPPLPMWYAGREAVRAWADFSPLSGQWRWKVARTSANGQPALGFYAWDETAGAFLPFALNVLTLRDGAVSAVVAFIARATDAPDGDAYERFPEQPADAQQVHGTFERFGLPPQLR